MVVVVVGRRQQQGQGQGPHTLLNKFLLHQYWGCCSAGQHEDASTPLHLLLASVKLSAQPSQPRSAAVPRHTGAETISAIAVAGQDSARCPCAVLVYFAGMRVQQEATATFTRMLLLPLLLLPLLLTSLHGS